MGEDDTLNLLAAIAFGAIGLFLAAQEEPPAPGDVSAEVRSADLQTH